MENYNQVENNLSKKERREQKRLEEELLVDSYNKKIKIRKILRKVTISSVVLIGAMFLVFWIFIGKAERPGEEISIQPAEHIKSNDPLPGLYLTNPPVSGWHYEETATLGVHDEEIKDQILISNLERGDIWISYHPDTPPEIVESLKSITQKYKKDVILTPRSTNDSMIALAAWGHLDKFNYFDEKRIIKFIKAFK